MEFLEKDLEEIIWESDNDLLIEKGLYIQGKKYRQLRIGNYGISDIITVQRTYDWCVSNRKPIPYLEITVFELKKDKVGIGAFLQSLKYCKGIQTYLKQKKPKIEFKLNIVLASKNVDLSGEFIYLTDLFEPYNEHFGFLSSIDFYSFKYDINGIVFKNEKGYNLINKGF